MKSLKLAAAFSFPPQDLLNPYAAPYYRIYLSLVSTVEELRE
jgi:hypothetical protein